DAGCGSLDSAKLCQRGVGTLACRVEASLFSTPGVVDSSKPCVDRLPVSSRKLAVDFSRLFKPPHGDRFVGLGRKFIALSDKPNRLFDLVDERASSFGAARRR